MKRIALTLVLGLLVAACAPSSTESDAAILIATDKAHFASLGEMFDAAEIVVHGEVVKVERGEILSAGAPEGEDSFLQMGYFTIRVDEALKGATGDTIVVVREAFVTSDAGSKPVIVNGIAPNVEGDEVVWFLEQSEGRDGVWEQVSYDGLLNVRDGKVATDLDSDGLARSLVGTQLSNLLAAVRTCAVDADCGSDLVGATAESR